MKAMDNDSWDICKKCQVYRFLHPTSKGCTGKFVKTKPIKVKK